MLVRFLFAAVLLAGCSAPVTRPSSSHLATDEADYRAGIDVARTDAPGQRELPVSLTAGQAGGVRMDTMDWNWVDQLPDNKTGCLIILVVVAVIIIASATFWP